MNYNTMQLNQTMHPKKMNVLHSSTSSQVNSLSSGLSDNSESDNVSSSTFSRIITQVSPKDELKANANLQKSNIACDSQLNLQKASHSKDEDSSLNSFNSLNSDSHKQLSENAMMVKRSSYSRVHQTVSFKPESHLAKSSENKVDHTVNDSQKVSVHESNNHEGDDLDISQSPEKDDEYDDSKKAVSEAINFLMDDQSEPKSIEKSSYDNFVIDERNSTLPHTFDGGFIINTLHNNSILTDEIDSVDPELMDSFEIDPDRLSKQPIELTIQSDSEEVFSVISESSEGELDWESQDIALPLTMTNESQFAVKSEDNSHAQQFSLSELEKFFETKLNGAFNAREAVSTVYPSSAGFQSQTEMETSKLVGGQSDVTNLSPASNLSLLSNNNTHNPNVLKQSIQISTPIYDEAFKDVLAERIVWLGSNQVKSASIFINPKDLGPVNIQIQYDNQKGASVQFQSEHLAVRDAIELGLPRLREIFHEQGLNLVETRVVSDNASQFQQDGSSTDGDHPASSRMNQWDTDNLNLDTNVAVGISYIREPMGLVDYYA